MKQILLFALMTFFVQTTFCQNLSDTVNVEYSKNSPKRFSIGLGIPITGFLWTIYPNLNHYLDENNVPDKFFSFTIPLSINYQVKRWRYSAEVYYGISSSTPSYFQNRNIEKNDLVGLSVGYAVFADRNKFIYFNLGVGAIASSQTIELNNGQTSNLSSALQSGIGQSVILKNNGAYVDFSLEFMLRNKQGQILGKSTKIGYRYGLQETPWNSEYKNFTNAPSDRISSFYLQFNLNIPTRNSFKRQMKL
ncbi:MAG: hypothetical protein V4585_02255 [Bacteroidota bacterium]